MYADDDLGGVLVENVGPARLATWLPTMSSHAAILDHWLTSPAVRAFERGQMAVEDFAAAVVQELGLPVSPTHFLADFALWANRLYPGALELLRQLKSNRSKGRGVIQRCLHNSIEVTQQKPNAPREARAISESPPRGC